MLVLILIWAILSGFCLCLGAILCHVCKINISSVGDRWIIYQWLGLLITADLLLGVSLIGAVTPTVGLILLITPIILCLAVPRFRISIQEIVQSLSVHYFLLLLLLFLAISVLSSQTVIWYDTGLYHYQVVQWLAKYGAVDGLAQVHHRFGFTSSWFALSAIFNHGILEARISTIVNGYIDILLITQLGLSSKRIMNKCGELPDWFMVIAITITWATCIHESLRTSLTPDYPIIQATLIINWLVFLSSKYKTDFLAVILSAALVSIKLSALPLLLISGLVFLISNYRSLKSLLACAITALIIVLPSLSYSLKVSGCPLFPSTFACIDTPWTYEPDSAKDISKSILLFARWFGSAPTFANDWNWLPKWAERELQATIQILLSVITTGIFISKSRITSTNLIVILTGMGGILFMMVFAPSWRFGLGYLTIIPAYGLGLLAIAGSHLKLMNLNLNQLLLGLLLFVLLIFSIKTNLNMTNWLIPPPLLSPEGLISKNIPSLTYTMPRMGDDRCWSASLVCTPENLENRVKLLNPQSGVAAGFGRQ